MAEISRWKPSRLLKFSRFILACDLGLVLARGVAFVHQAASHAAQGPAQAVQKAASQAQALTQILIALGTSFQQAGVVPQARQSADLLGVAKDRQHRLTTLIDRDPREALNVALPDSLLTFFKLSKWPVLIAGKAQSPRHPRGQGLRG